MKYERKLRVVKRVVRLRTYEEIAKSLEVAALEREVAEKERNAKVQCEEAEKLQAEKLRLKEEIARRLMEGARAQEAALLEPYVKRLEEERTAAEQRADAAAAEVREAVRYLEDEREQLKEKFMERKAAAKYLASILKKRIEEE